MAVPYLPLEFDPINDLLIGTVNVLLLLIIGIGSLPAWIKGLLVLEDLAGLKFLLVDGLFLLCELAPIFLTLKQ